MARPAAKQRSSGQLRPRRSARKSPLSPPPAEPTSAFLHLREEFDQEYSLAVDHQEWLVEARRFPELALLAFRRWLRNGGFDVSRVGRAVPPRKSRFKDVVEFKITFDKELKSAFNETLQGPSDESQFELFCRALQIVLSRFGVKTSPLRQVPDQELTLIREIDAFPPGKTSKRFRELSQRCFDEALSDTERTEFLKLALVVESHHLKRLRAAESLSQLRGQDFFQVVDEFGLGKPSDD